jgi:hypothetical protein
MDPQVLSSPDYANALASISKEFADAQVFSSWMPPDGDYAVLVTEADTGISKKSGQADMLWWRLTCQIESEGDPSLHNKTFSIAYNSLAIFNLKAALAALEGSIIDDVSQASRILQETVGNTLLVRVTRGQAKKTGKKFIGTDILEVIAKGEPVPVGEGEAPANDPA